MQEAAPQRAAVPSVRGTPTTAHSPRTPSATSHSSAAPCAQARPSPRASCSPARSPAPPGSPARPRPPHTRAGPETEPTVASIAVGNPPASSTGSAACTTPPRPGPTRRLAACGDSRHDRDGPRSEGSALLAPALRSPRRALSAVAKTGRPPRARASRGYLFLSHVQVSARGRLDQVFCGRCASVPQIPCSEAQLRPAICVIRVRQWQRFYGREAAHARAVTPL
jgi:hypothetical protein